MIAHLPVLAAEAVQYLQPERGGVFVDCTIGLGGHTSALLAAGATRIIELDRDLDALDRARETLAPWLERVDLVHADFRSLDIHLDAADRPRDDVIHSRDLAGHGNAVFVEGAER